ncbi:hypothetical protein DL98DRAFT_531174 [Cadophora sp. DSE1049]|nr:hypothetical protein DL98DRAFT_531174 [Cadophora sp. DSE1049]
MAYSAISALPESSQQTKMDYSHARKLAPPELATYFRGLLSGDSSTDQSTTKSIFAAVERELLPPNIVSVWLSIEKSPAAASTHSAILSLHPEETWDGVGGMPGILALLKEFSVLEVNMCLARFSRWQNGPDRIEKQAKVTELLQSLLPSNYPEAPFQSSEERPFRESYGSLLPGCTSKFVENMIHNSGPVEIRSQSDILREHYQLLRQRCLESLFDSTKSCTDVMTYLQPLIRSAPDIPSNKVKFSESMAFSLLILEKLASQPEITPPFTGLTDLIEPLVRRMQKRTVDLATTKDVLELALKYLSAHPEEARHITFHPFTRHRLMYACVRLWAASLSHQQEAEALLESVLGMVPAEQRRNLIHYSIVISTVPKPLRYRLLKLMFLHIGDESIDIEDSESLKSTAISMIFFDLPPDEASQLLIRLQKVNPWKDFLAKGRLSHPLSQQLPSANPDILLNLLEADRPGVLERATCWLSDVSHAISELIFSSAAVEDAKSKSVKSQEQVDRAFHAKSALSLAISSGSLELYGETLLWARRFVRDPLTAKSVFAKLFIITADGISLLSGLPGNLQGVTVPKVAQGIETSKRVVFELFETVVFALKEPSFSIRDWEGPLDLVSDIIREWLSRSLSLQKALASSDDQLYILMLKSTLDLAIRIGSIGLQPGYERLELRNPSGLVRLATFKLDENECGSPPCLRFVDEFARQRDMLWQTLRRSLHPATMVLSPLLPRGLPIQCLISGFELRLSRHSKKTPFIFSYAEQLVFAERELLIPIPDDEVTRAAIGSFVDSFRVALQIYSDGGMEACYCKTEWTYDKRGSSSTVATRFSEAVPTFEIPPLSLPELETNRKWPIFPFDAKIGRYIEWNPLEEHIKALMVEPRQALPLTYLDLTLAFTPYSRSQLSGHFQAYFLHTPGFTPPTSTIWSLGRLTNKELRIAAVREGLVVSALLYLEQFIPNHKSILASPFPSPAAVRYPDMWLDLSFVEYSGTVTTPNFSSFNPLRFYLSDIPPSLILRLTETCFDALFKATSESDGKVAELEMLSFQFLHLLSQSDQPSLAIELILKTVIGRPDSSPWHRKLLSVRFLKTLSTTQAKAVIQSFADSIQEQMRVPILPKPSASSEKPATKSYVKITTIKYLAQLLHGAKFVPEAFAVDLLATLFVTASHIDVRVAIVESLMTMLAGCREELLATKIFEALEHAIPIARRLDEQYELSRADWEEAETMGTLPVVFNHGSTRWDLDLPPIIEALIISTSERWKERLLTQIIAPILKESIATNTRWLELFTAKHDVDFHTLRLPLLPVKLKFFKLLLERNMRYLPASLMDLYQSFILTSLSPPPALSDLNSKLQDPELIRLPEVSHWLSLCGHSDRPNIFNYIGFDITALLRQDWPYAESSITVTQLQAHKFQHAEVLVSRSNIQTFDRLLNSFAPPSDPRAISSLDWLKNARPVLELIVAHIEFQRTPEWQQNLHREPKFLPSTLKPRLWLLPYPPTDASVLQLSAFVDSVRDILAEICKPGRLYHEELPELQKAMKRVLPEFRASVACLLGKLKEEMTTADLLSIDISKSLLKDAPRPTDDGALELLKRIMRSWVASTNEVIRGKGLEAAKSEIFKGLEGVLD